MSKISFATTKTTHEATGMMRWLLTYADMLTLLFAMFVIFVAISIAQQGEIEALKKRQVIIVQRDPRDELLINQFNSFIGKEKLGEVVSTQIYPFGILIRLASSGFIFDVGKATLKPGAKHILHEVARLLKQYSFQNEIEVEGHTDTAPIHGLYASNWELSAARAVSVSRYLIETEKLDPSKVTPVAFGQYHPVIAGAKGAEMAKNRRIDIRILRVSRASLESSEFLDNTKGNKTPLQKPQDAKPNHE